MASIQIDHSSQPSRGVGLPIIFEDDSIIVINKPFGLRSTPAFKFEENTNPLNQKRKRQERFSDVLESLTTSTSSICSEYQPYLDKLSKEHLNVPRKLNKFISYAKRSLRIEDEHIISDLFSLISSKVTNEEKKEGASLTDSVLTRVKHSHTESATAVHRLDMETSGLLVVALTKEAGQELNRQFRDREVSKTYVALVRGHVLEESGSITLPLMPDDSNRPRQVVNHENGKPALTEWKIRERFEIGKEQQQELSSSSSSSSNSTLIELNPRTGRTHQLRVHLQAIGYPIIGDSLYNLDEASREMNPDDRLMLHAERIAFKHPVTKVSMDLFARASFS